MRIESGLPEAQVALRTEFAVVVVHLTGFGRIIGTGIEANRLQTTSAGGGLRHTMSGIRQGDLLVSVPVKEAAADFLAQKRIAIRN